MNDIRIPGIVGSLRRDFYNLFALRVAQQMASHAAVLELIDLRGIPVFLND